MRSLLLIGLISLTVFGSRFSETELRGEVDTTNSTSATLGVDGVYTGSAKDALNCAIVYVNVYSDVASATDGLSMQQSSDGTNWDHTDDYTIPAGGGKNYSINPHSKYFRVVYTNGSVAQTEFRLQTICKTQYSKASSHRAKDDISGDDDVELVKAAITGLNGNGDWHNVKTTSDGYLTISDNSSGLAIAKGDVTGYSFIHKFGNAPDFDQTDGIVDVWDGSEDGTAWENFTYEFSSTADIDSVVSNSTDSVAIEVQGLGADSLLLLDTITLTGTAAVQLNAPFLRIFRMRNINSTDLVGHVFVFTTATSAPAGVPADADEIRAIIQPGNNQTLMAIYTIPKGKKGYMRDWYASTSGANKNSNYPISLFARAKGSVFQLKHISALSDNGTSSYQHNYTEPEVFGEFTDIIIRTQILEVGTTAASVSAGFDIVLTND